MAGENRGFVLNGQRVVLDLDFAGSVKATAYLTIKPTNVRLSTVFLHAAPCLRITAVHLSGPNIDDPLPALPASFSHYNPLLGLKDLGDGTPLNPNLPDSIQRHPEIKRKLWAAMAEKDEGELAIDVSHGWVRIAQTKDGGPAAQAGLAEILIAIDYEVCMSDVDTEGIVWRRPGDAGNDFVSLFDRPVNVHRQNLTGPSNQIWNSGYHICLSTRPLTMLLDIGYPVWTISGTDARGSWKLVYPGI